MTAPALCQRISEFCEFLSTEGLALTIQGHSVFRVSGRITRVKWVSQQSEGTYNREPDIRLQEYLDALQYGDYSFVLNDGGLFQISMDFDGGRLVGNRMAYLPCPIEFGIDDVFFNGDFYPIQDFILDLGNEEFRSRLRAKAPLRFEFDPEGAKEAHPASHLHMGRSSCRVPVSHPLTWDHFGRFVFKHFYPNEFKRVSDFFLFPHPKTDRTLSDTDSTELHFTM